MNMGKMAKILIIIFLVLCGIDTIRYFAYRWTSRPQIASTPQVTAAAQQPVDNTPTVQAIPDVVITQSGKLILQKDTATAEIWNIQQIADMVPQIPNVWHGPWKDNGSEVSDWSAKSYVPGIDFQPITLLRVRFYFEVTKPGDYVLIATTTKGGMENVSASMRINDQRIVMSINNDIDTGYLKFTTKGFYAFDIMFASQKAWNGNGSGGFSFKIKAPGDTQPHTISHIDMYWPIEPIEPVVTTDDTKSKKEAL